MQTDFIDVSLIGPADIEIISVGSAVYPNGCIGVGDQKMELGIDIGIEDLVDKIIGHLHRDADYSIRISGRIGDGIALTIKLHEAETAIMDLDGQQQGGVHDGRLDNRYQQFGLDTRGVDLRDHGDDAGRGRRMAADIVRIGGRYRKGHIVIDAAAKAIDGETGTDQHADVHIDAAAYCPVMETTGAGRSAELCGRIELGEGEGGGQRTSYPVSIGGVVIEEIEFAVDGDGADIAVDDDLFTLNSIEAGFWRASAGEVDRAEDTQVGAAADDGGVAETDADFDVEIDAGFEAGGAIGTEIRFEVGEAKAEAGDGALRGAVVDRGWGGIDRQGLPGHSMRHYPGLGPLDARSPGNGVPVKPVGIGAPPPRLQVPASK